MAEEQGNATATEEYVDSPTQRLYDLLMKFNEKADNKTSVKKRWEAILDLDENDDSEFFRRYSEVLSLAPKAYDELRRLGDIYVENFANVRSFFSLGLSASSQNAKDQVAGIVLNTLKLGAYQCRQTARRFTWPAGYLDNLEEQITALLAELETANVAPPLKKILTQHLESILYAVAHFDIFGPDGLEHRVQTAVGAYVIEAHRDPAAVKNPEARKFGDVLKNVMNALQLVKAGGDVLKLVHEYIVTPLIK